MFGLVWAKFLVYFGAGLLLARGRAPRARTERRAPSGRAGARPSARAAVIGRRRRCTPVRLALAVSLVADWPPAVAQLVPRWPRRGSRGAGRRGARRRFSPGSVVLVALESGIDAFDDRLLRVHMVQHMLLLMVAPCCCSPADPVLLTLRVLPPSGRPTAGSRCSAAAVRGGPVARLFAARRRAHTSAVVLRRHPPHPGCMNSSTRCTWWPGSCCGRRCLTPTGPQRTSRRPRPARVPDRGDVPMALLGAYLNRHPTLVYPATVRPPAPSGSPR